MNPLTWQWRFRAALIRLLDADTVAMRIDLGFHVSCEQLLRLWGVSAPELSTDAGKAALLFVRQWFDWHQHTPSTWPFIIDTDKEKQTFARFIARVRCLQEHDLGEALIESGYGVAS